MAALGPPLSIVLDSRRWVSVALRRAFTRHLRRCHAELRHKLAADSVDAHVFVSYVGATAREALTPLSQEVRGRYHAAWQAVLQTPPGAREVVRTVDELRARADERFAAAGPSSRAGISPRTSWSPRRWPTCNGGPSSASLERSTTTTICCGRHSRTSIPMRPL